MPSTHVTHGSNPAGPACSAASAGASFRKTKRVEANCASTLQDPLQLRLFGFHCWISFSPFRNLKSFSRHRWPSCNYSRKLQRRVLRQLASPIQHSITQHNITPQQDTPQQDPPQHHTPQQDIHRSKTPHLQTGLYSILIIFLIIS